MQPTGPSRKEECVLSEQDDVRMRVDITKREVGLVPQVKHFFEFLGKVREEMKLVHHPGWDEVRSTTLVVIVFVFLFALYLRGLDLLFSPLDRWLFGH
jgi:preprotein translocase SecE subunit